MEGDQDRDGVFNEGANGFDDPVDASGRHYAVAAAGVAPDGKGDDDLEAEAPPPYPHPLRGIQIKIRVFEPDSRQIREVTVVQEFVGK